jgi:hypothetical protein
MSGPTQVFIVCSPRPHTGKTLVARLIAEFYHSIHRPPVCFDLEQIDPALTEFLPLATERAAIGETRGQVALFDKLVLADERPKIIDLSPHALEKFFTVAYDIGFDHEARAHGVSAVVMYVAGQQPLVQETYRILREKLPSLIFVPVHNDAVARGPELRKQFPANANSPPPIEIPQLSSSLRRIMDQRPFSFVQFLKDPPIRVSRSLREEMDAFVRRVFRQLHEMELSLLMNQLNHSLEAQLKPAPKKTGTK